ncbi:MAG: RES domain-containing protein [Nakamurella sp.]
MTGAWPSNNPSHYDTRYFALQPEVAIGEVLGDLPRWSDEVFLRSHLPTGRLALGRYRILDQLPVLDMDDAQNLLDRGLRPTQVTARNRPVTQSWSLRVFREVNSDGSRKWAGIRWWSFQRPHRTMFTLWVAPGEPLPHTFVDAMPLSITDQSVSANDQTSVRQLNCGW